MGPRLVRRRHLVSHSGNSCHGALDELWVCWLPFLRIMVVFQTQPDMATQADDLRDKREIISAERGRKPITAHAVEHVQIGFQALEGRGQAKR